MTYIICYITFYCLNKKYLAKIVLWVIVHTQMHAGVVQKKILKLAVHGYEKDTSEMPI